MGEGQECLSVFLPERFSSEGLSESVLGEFVDNVELRRVQVLEALYAQLEEHYRQQGDLAVDSVDDAAEALPEMEGAEEAQAFDIAALARERAAVLQRIAEAQAAAATIGLLAEAQQRLASFDAHFTSGAYSEAADDAAGIAALCEEHPELRAQGLQRSYDERMKGLLEALAYEVAQRVAADPAQRQLRVARRGEGGDAWRALGMLGALDVQLERLAGVVMQGVVHPLLAAQGPVHVTTSEGWFGDGPAALLEWREEGPLHGPATLDQPDLLEKALLCSLRFLSRHAFQGEEVLAVQLGRYLWGQLAHAYIEAHLSHMLPKNDSQIDSFQAAATAARQFESDAAAMGFVPLDGEGRGPIRDYVQQALDRFLHAKRLAAVSRARDLLMDAKQDLLTVGSELPVNPEALPPSAAPDADAGEGGGNLSRGATPNGKPALTHASNGSRGTADAPLNWGPEGEEGPLLATGRFKVTGTGMQLAEQLREVVAEAAASGSPAVAQSLCGAACDIAHLQLALPPVVKARELQVPQGAALYHNDCRYIAAELLALPRLFEPNLSRMAPLAAARFIAAALELRAAAQSTLLAQVRQQQAEMAEVVGGADRFRRIHEGQRGITARRVVQQLLAGLRRLGDLLGDVLAPREFVAVAAAVVQAVAERIAGDLLELADINVEASEELPRILGPLAADAASAVVGGALPDDDTSGLLDRKLLLHAVELGAPALAKLGEVLDLMTARLAVFRERWGSGRLQALGFSRRQTMHLIEALFEDTDLRRSTLSAIRAG